jgi:hypothetical protein
LKYIDAEILDVGELNKLEEEMKTYLKHFSAECRSIYGSKVTTNNLCLSGEGKSTCGGEH